MAILAPESKKQAAEKAIENKKEDQQKKATPRRSFTQFEGPNPYDENYGKAIRANADAIRLASKLKRDAEAAQQNILAMKTDRTENGYRNLLNLLFRYTAAGNFENQEELFFSRIDRFGNSLYTPNVEHSGITFFTRPKLPLTAGNLMSCPSLATLNTLAPKSRAFAIRCWLDTRFSNQNGARYRDGKAFEETPYYNAVNQCTYFDDQSAMLIPLSNACVAQSGWPDPFIQTFTTTGGYYCEDQTFPIGSDRLRKTYDINFTFREGPGAPILALLYTWYEAMACLCEGSMIAYAEDINAQRMCYTCSIYRFLLDPSKTHITHYAKATGCFPKAPPLGALFNQSKGETNIAAASEISIPFVCNKVEYDDPRILLDFNFLVTRYCKDIASFPILKPEPYNNFKGYPFVISTQKGLELVFRERLEQAYDDDKSHKMPATTRERFELMEQFEGIKINTANASDKDKEAAKRVPRGTETRFSYRVKESTEKDTVFDYVLAANDDYKSEQNLPDDITKNAINPYTGVPLNDTLRPLLGNPINTPSTMGVRDAEGNVVDRHDPITVTGTKAGLPDMAAKNRADTIIDLGETVSPLRLAKGNQDIVDAGTAPNQGRNHFADNTKTKKYGVK